MNEVCAGGACTLSCPAGLLKCNGKCIDPNADPNHCGATADCDTTGGTSGSSCAAGEVCSAGSCALSCQTGLINCQGICVDPSSNRLYCGATSGCGTSDGNPGNACDEGEVCSGGACTVSCQTGMVKCEGACIDPSTNRAHCGAIGDCSNLEGGNSAGSACASGNLCVAGTCVVSCPTGSVNCGGVCINPAADNGHCGALGDCTNIGVGNAAGSACSQGRVCNNGSCAVACPPRFVNCDGVCVDPATSRAHCGASGSCNSAGNGNSPGVACTVGNLCVGGSCVISCPTGSVNCGGVCVDPRSDNNRCGAAGDCTNVGVGNSTGSVCSPGSACTAGLCAASCSSGLHACSNMCVDWTYNPTHCGGCGVSCSSNHIAQPTCFASTCNGACDSGYSDCDGSKLTNGCEVSSGSDTANCGGCSLAGDHNCNRNASGGTCSDGVCSGATCTTGYANCDGLARNGCETPAFGLGSPGAPGFASISNYFPLDGSLGDIVNGASIPATIGSEGIASNDDWGMAYVDGHVNQALQLDGWDDTVDLGVAVGNFGTADFSISMWIRTPPAYRTQWILTKRAYCSHAPFWNVGITEDGRLIFEMDQDYDGTNYGNINGTATVTDDAWHHIAFVRQGTAMRIYLDGNLDGSGLSNGVTNLTESYNVRIGQISCAWGQNFGGLIDDLTIWSGYALTQSETHSIACVAGH
ncbi:MAG: LamG-like jellyroll fold domain-containing protein [Myxococcales bacterium]